MRPVVLFPNTAHFQERRLAWNTQNSTLALGILIGAAFSDTRFSLFFPVWLGNGGSLGTSMLYCLQLAAIFPWDVFLASVACFFNDGFALDRAWQGFFALLSVCLMMATWARSLSLRQGGGNGGNTNTDSSASPCSTRVLDVFWF